MAWTKAKTAIVVSAGLLLAAGTTTVITIAEVFHHREESVWSYITANDAGQLEKAPAAVSIRLTKFDPETGGQQRSDGKILGLCQPFGQLLADAYNISPYRIVSSTPLPEGNFDYIDSTAKDQGESLQKLLADHFGITIRHEIRATNVLALTVMQRNAPALKHMKVSSNTRWTRFGEGWIACSNAPIADIAVVLEKSLGTPVVDWSGRPTRFYGELQWQDTGKLRSENPDGLKQALLDQFGLSLVPGNKPIEMLVVDKTK